MTVGGIVCGAGERSSGGGLSERVNRASVPSSGEPPSLRSATGLQSSIEGGVFTVPSVLELDGVGKVVGDSIMVITGESGQLWSGP